MNIDSLEANPVFGGGKGEEVFKGFLLEEYGKSLSKAGGIGLADNVKQEMIRMQEESQI
jgi:flagellar protein FlgJ